MKVQNDNNLFNVTQYKLRAGPSTQASCTVCRDNIHWPSEQGYVASAVV